jgi:NTP pyrophosphatase (non-canonical NTP hydrolase)
MNDKIIKPFLAFLGELFNFISNLRVQNLAFLAILLLLIWLLIVNRRLRKKLKDEIADVKFHVQKIDKKLEFKKAAEEIRAEHKEKRIEQEKPKTEAKYLEVEKAEWHGPTVHPGDKPGTQAPELESILELRPELEKTPEHKVEMESKTKEELAAIEVIRKSEEKRKNDKPKKLSEEYIFVLRAIGDEPDKTYQKEGLHQLYRMVYPKKDKRSFDLIIERLEKSTFITKSDTSSGYKVWYEITEKGLAYLKR